ncbi:molybdopterin molybdotransferase MoeA [Adlercreutzia sp. ZJ473]|uniref:molybdopterin molybdotransferase MoeA n=1 Tax=Adlercreutzia sp. ZJ473 TaxID=2722822 RepID=UPI0015540E3E|nr:molybdopterin molybdotransferase MoeA [Adlercreutzia sp. ZJ473]
MRDHTGHIELSREDAVDQILRVIEVDGGQKKPSIDRVPLNEAYGRVLAEDIYAKTDIPNVRSCAMDSIAVRWDHFQGLAEGELPDTSGWVRGVDWEFANTGVAMPTDFDTAIVIEHVIVSDDEQHVEIAAAPSERFAGTREAGSTFRRGDLIVEKGCVIAPDIAAQIASAGYASIEVAAKPRVAFIATGNELVSPNIPFASDAPEKFAGIGKVYESNSAVVQGKVEAWGGIFIPFDIVPDEREAIRAAVVKACSVADIVVLNAGSSKGSDDWSVEVLEGMGTIICHETKHGPGHHSSYAFVENTPIVGISGPSGGASFTLNFYLLPIMKSLLGLDPTPRLIPAVLFEEFPARAVKKPDQTGKPSGEARPSVVLPDDEFYAIRFVTLEAGEQGNLVATPVKGHPGSAQMQKANAYYMMPMNESKAPRKGDVIKVELRNASL